MSESIESMCVSYALTTKCGTNVYRCVYRWLQLGWYECYDYVNLDEMRIEDYARIYRVEVCEL